MWNSTLKRHTPLKAETPLKSHTRLKVKKGLNKISAKTAGANRKWLGIVLKIAEQVGYKCEICGKYIGFVGEFGLSGHHIIHRSKGRIDTEENCLVGCCECHNHAKYTEGIPISAEEALEIASKRSRNDDE